MAFLGRLFGDDTKEKYERVLSERERMVSSARADRRVEEEKNRALSDQMNRKKEKYEMALSAKERMVSSAQEERRVEEAKNRALSEEIRRKEREHDRELCKKEQMVGSAQEEKRLEEAKNRALSAEIRRKEREHDRELNERERMVSSAQAEKRLEEEKNRALSDEMGRKEGEASLNLQMERDRAKDAQRETELLREDIESERAASELKVEGARKETMEADERRQRAELETKDSLVRAERVKNEMQSEMYERMMGMQEKQIQWMGDVTKSVVENQTKQIESLSRGMESIARSLSSMAVTDGNQPGASSILNLKKPFIVVIDNFGPRDNPRKWISKDQAKLRKLFEPFKGSIEVKKGECLAEVLEECNEEDYSANDGIFVIVFAHGKKMLLHDGPNVISLQKLFEPFLENETLKEKPKIFLVQAIQPSCDLVSEDQEQSIENPENVLTCYCEMPERLYIDHFTNEGSLFVKSFREALQNNPQLDMAKILEEVGNKLTKCDQAQSEGVVFTTMNDLKVPVRFA